MSVLGFIGSIFKPATDLVDNLHTSEEEKAELRNKFEALQNAATFKLLEYETKLMEAQASIVSAEAKGNNLQRNWRPITMLSFVGLIVLESLGWLAKPLSPEIFTIIKFGMTGYIVGRSAEKGIKEWKNKA